MNERIRELAKQCTEYVEGTLDGNIVVFDHNKFAELIVRECAKMVDDDGDAVMALRILKQFGVK